MDHELRNISQVYGFFAIVLGILWWIYLAAQIVVYSAELNASCRARLWPRGLVQPPLTAADIAALGSYATGRAAPARSACQHLSYLRRDSTRIGS